MSERLSFEEIDRLMGEDPDDRAIREAHGFTYEDNWQDEALLCRNGCGLSYPDIAAGKIRKCNAMASVTGIMSGAAVTAEGRLASASLSLVAATDPAAFYEGFCPNCRVPLGGDTGSWCPRCRAAWRVIP